MKLPKEIQFIPPKKYPLSRTQFLQKININFLCRYIIQKRNKVALDTGNKSPAIKNGVTDKSKKNSESDTSENSCIFSA
jgi:hypothetical protein